MCQCNRPVPQPVNLNVWNSGIVGEMDELQIEQTSILSERLGGFLVQIYLQNSYFILELKKNRKILRSIMLYGRNLSEMKFVEQ